MRDMAFRVTRRLAEEASAPAYQALIKVRSSPKARIAMLMLRMVRDVRSLWRKAFLRSSLRMYIIQEPLFQMSDHPCPFGGSRIGCDHNEGFTRTEEHTS